ncbi:hypothetical protein CFIMG_005814RA [Ceratocystis fimbriata CBS 114723]|uniref:Ornithine decarboxylase antizyme n=2 Tax=Ceratocystis TaxID=5157 RepID=A0A0F8AXV4_CERFI|nr:Ornithine decarboxylase antizyme [Ceratocystis platani]PHH51912.1 hypothetical protein CFIMG_005814RA [Ceratocystis fimbriata CBS 114723]
MASTTLLPGFPGPSGIPEVPSSGVPSPPSSPPLAAVKPSSHQIAILPKPGRSRHASTGSRSRDLRGGAALTIREDCERFFCETMAAVFLGERNAIEPVSGLTSASSSSPSASYLLTPPDDLPFGGSGPAARNYRHRHSRMAKPPVTPVIAWAEIWDFQGGASFRAFVADNCGVKTLFIFFHNSVVHLDLKPALMAIMELAEGPLGCHDVVALIDKYTESDSAKALMRSLQWVGFELTTLEPWANRVDVTSDHWHTMCMEV